MNYEIFTYLHSETINLAKSLKVIWNGYIRFSILVIYIKQEIRLILLLLGK